MQSSHKRQMQLRDVEMIVFVTRHYHWLIKPLLHMYKKYFDVPLTFFSDRPIEGCNVVEVFPRDMYIYRSSCWGLIKDALRKIDKPVVALILADEFPIDVVDVSKLQILVEYMIGDTNVARGNLQSDFDDIVRSSKELLCEGEGFSILRMSSKIHGQVGSTSLNPALWRRDFLLEFTEDDWTLDALELPGQYKFMAQNKWYSVGMLPEVFYSCHLCYTADRSEVRLSTIKNEEDRAYVAQFVPEGSRIT